ncbi:MAG: vWA domain-containing protein [Planctomycetota bacterium]
MVIEQPIWLLLLLPLGLLWWKFPAPSKALQVMRAVLLVLIVLALSSPALPLADRAGTVVVIADRSTSMPDAADRAIIEQVALIQDGMSPADRLAVVTFGGNAVLEHPADLGAFDAFSQVINPEGSNLSDAIRNALAVIPPDSPGRIIVLSDGLWTGRDPMPQALDAVGRDIAIDYRELSRPRANDVSIEHVDAPLSVGPGQSFMITAWVNAPTAQDIEFEILRGNTRIAQGEHPVTAGLNRLTFRDTAGEPGTADYRIRIVTQQPDPLPENNTGRFLVGIEGEKPVLVISETQGAGLARLLTQGGLPIEQRTPDEVDWSLEGLTNYSAVVLENVPAQSLTTRGTENLAAYIDQAGAGMLITGGQRSYGPGGYFKTPLDPLIPVSMELRQEHRKLSLAIVVAMDRSGSMAAPVSGGRMKMDLANLGAAEVLGLLSPADEFGVIAVDTRAHMIVPLDQVGSETAATRGRILGIDSMGGGIYVYEALSNAANMLVDAEAQTRHIILFSDAADSVEPGAYKELLEHCSAANITVSVIGLGSPTDPHAVLLEDIARRGNGRIFFTKDAMNLPQLFAQDTFVVARSSFLDEPTPVATTPLLSALVGQPLSQPPSVGGYNLTYLRPDAQLGALTRDEYNAPLVAYWQVGAGRVAAYTGEADGEFTGAISTWGQTGEMFSSLARWVAGRGSRLPNDMLVTQDVVDGVKTVTLHLSPERELPQPFEKMPVVTTLTGRPDAPPAVTELSMQWTGTDTLAVQMPVQSQETSLSTVTIPGLGQTQLSPTRLLYSPEFRTRGDREGVENLESIAELTRGMSRIDLASIWQDLPEIPRQVAVGHWLMFASIFLILLEVLERRVGVFALLHRSESRRQPAEPSAETEEALPTKKAGGWGSVLRRKKTKQATASLSSSASADPPAVKQAKAKEKPSPPAESPGISSALEHARRSADHRTKK